MRSSSLWLALGLLMFAAVPARADVPPPVTCSASDHGGEACNNVVENGVCVSVAGTMVCRTACTRVNAPCCGVGISFCSEQPWTSSCPGQKNTTNDYCETGTGQCLSDANGTYCVPLDTPCSGQGAGASCQLENGMHGTCASSDAAAGLVCTVSSSTASSGKGGGGGGGCASAPGGVAASWLSLIGIAGVALVGVRRRRRTAS